MYYEVTIEILRKFPCVPLELKIAPKNVFRAKSEYIYLPSNMKLYVTTSCELILTTYRFSSGQTVSLRRLKLEPFILRDICYKRTSTDFKFKPFMHRFNQKEKIYSCNYKNNLLYFVWAGQPLCEIIEEERPWI